MNELLRRLPLVFVEDLETPELRESDYVHLTKSRRFTDGEEIIVGDGRGAYRKCSLAQLPDALTETLVTAKPADTTIFFPPVKNERPDYVVQKLTELGVRRIGLIQTERSVVKWDFNKAVHKIEKLREVARQAAMQSKQLWLPDVTGMHDIEELKKLGVSLAEPGGEIVSDSNAAIAVGPEGGFSSEELAGSQTVALPGGILRSETAAVVAGTLLVESVSHSL